MIGWHYLYIHFHLNSTSEFQNMIGNMYCMKMLMNMNSKYKFQSCITIFDCILKSNNRH